MSIAVGQTAAAQDIIKGVAWYAADAGANDTYAITLPTAPSAYADGLTVRFKANTANTGPATLNVNSLGAITIKRPDLSDLKTGDILANQIVEVVYRGGSFYVISPLVQIKERFLTPLLTGTTPAYPYTTILDDWAVQPVGAGSSTQFSHFIFRVPADFNALSEAKILCIPDTTETVSWEASASKAAVGEAYNSDRDAYSVSESLAVTNGQLAELDINKQSIFTGMAAGDYVAIEFNSLTSVIRVVGLRITYT